MRDRLRRRRAPCAPLSKALAPYGEQILDCFSADGATLTAEEIGSMTSLQPTTVEDLAYILVMLRCLVEHGSGRVDSDRGRRRVVRLTLDRPMGAEVGELDGGVLMFLLVGRMEEGPAGWGFACS